ncbi:MAG: isoniazid response ATPase/transcriptional regulator IniR [Mycobacterium sp.]|nr:isoniazid response ATPase/transcriptional regulator IniR [Mycobacterium sp.]
MADPASVQRLPPAATAAVGALAAGPVKLVVTGGVGTGKSTVLAAVRDTLREAGTPVVTRAPQPGDPAGAAVVIDDAHLLSGDELGRLTELAGEQDTTLVIATEPREQDGDLRALTVAIERQRPRLTLGPLTAGEAARLLTDPSGHPPPADLVATLMTATGGIPALVSAVIAAPRPHAAPAIAQGALFALIERVRRLDEAELDALLITSLSSELGAADVAAALDAPAESARVLVDRVRATGLVEPSHPPRFLRQVHRAVAQIVGTARHHDLESALLRTQAEMSTLSTELALRLAEHGVRDPRLADLLRRHAGAVRGDTSLAVRVHRAAVEAGATELRTRLADALGAAGDCAAAAALADDLLGSDDPAERAAAVRVAAGVAAHDGNLAQAAELFSWLGPDPDAAVSAAAAVSFIGTGNAVAARAALATGGGGPPTAAARAARSLAEGLLLTLDGPYPTAAAKLGQAMAVDHPAGVVIPDSAPALITLAALHGGDPVRARSVIGRAVRVGGDLLFEHRHRLLLSWVKMQDGQLSAAGADLPPTDRLHRRDALWAAALRTALARRGGDPGAAQKHWYAGMEVLAEYSMDLFSLLPLGELWMAAARMGQQDRLAPMLENAFAILGELGDPLSWSVPLHWAGVHAGILANDPAAVAPHGQALAAAAARIPFAGALAGAGRTWLRVLAGQVDPDEVGVAARGLARFGLASDATRLAGQAALQAADPKVSGLMLQVARDLKLAAADTDVDGVDSAEAAPADVRATRRAPSSPLSDREREVAELLLLGMPYRDIGAQLFISAKTVEHHVARIRRRLGAESRSEMLSMLRAMLTPDGSTAATP